MEYNTSMFERPIDPTRFMIIGVFPKMARKEDIIITLEETSSLIKTYGGDVFAVSVQRSDSPDRTMFFGKGKVEELCETVVKENIQVVVLHNAVKARQIFALQKQLSKVKQDIIVWDRVDLILYIFSKHAQTAEAKLQIELAAMRHMGPRIYGMGFELSRQGGGIGGVGIGETNTELMKRHWRDQIQKANKELKKLTEEKERQLEKRRRSGQQTVSLVGYTNAGKSSLFNLLTGKEKLVEDALFATLDSVVGKWYLHQLQKEIMVSDTIGFIKDLPPKLIDAFKSTLMESVHADVLLHVIDSSDPQMEEKIGVVEKVLYELDLTNRKRIYVFNKIDRAKDIDRKAVEEKYEQFTPVFISVKEKQGIDNLAKAVVENLT
jgi:GTP-binding protein HflX